MTSRGFTGGGALATATAVSVQRHLLSYRGSSVTLQPLLPYGFYRIAKEAENAVTWRKQIAKDEAQEMNAIDTGVSAFFSEAVERKKRLRLLVAGLSLLTLAITVAIIGGLSMVA
ncbi:MAG: hypothetical protein P8Y67_15235 [Alphaproteobacteria bacterium]